MKNILTFLFCAILFSCNQQKENNTIEEKLTETPEQESEWTQFGMSGNSVPKGLEVGQKIPEVSVNIQSREEIPLHELYGEQPLVVIFYRGNWCPACNKHLLEFTERGGEIEEAGAKILIVTPESHENIQKNKEETGNDFMVVSDVDGSIMTAFDVDFEVTKDYQQKIQDKFDTSISQNNTSKEAVLPVPATYIINRNGEVVYKHFNPDYTVRASIDDILANLPEDNAVVE